MLTKFRVYQRDLADQIRIGMTSYAHDIEKKAEDIKGLYAERFGSDFIEGAKEYYEAIALVDADTLKPIKVLFGDF